MKSAFYTVALGAAMVLTASTASVRAEDRDCTVDLKGMCAGIAPGEGHIRACIQAHMALRSTVQSRSSARTDAVDAVRTIAAPSATV